jgi:hypothetical protein
VKCNFVCQSDGRARHASGAGAAEPNVAIGTNLPSIDVRSTTASGGKADIARTSANDRV